MRMFQIQQTLLPRASNNLPAPLDENQTWVPLGVYNLYRTVIAAILNVLFLLSNIPEFENQVPILPHDLPRLLSITLYLYLAFSLLCHFLTRIRIPDYQSQALLQITIDILAIVLLMQASASSSLASLLVIVICAAGILLPGQLSFFCTAIASISLISNQIFIGLSYGQQAANYSQAGVMGVVLFLTAIIINLMSQRLAVTAQQAFEHRLELQRLERLNSLIVDKVNIGAFVINPSDIITLMNKSAAILFGKTREECLGHPLSSLSPTLNQDLRQWRNNPKVLSPVTLQKQGEKIKITPHLLGRLDESREPSLLVFLEDLSIRVKEAQAIKLAAIGRLTASIAHEIRNPLMAIANATQLLLESGHFHKEERRLLSMIDDNTKRTNSVIDSILNISRSRAPNPSVISLASWLSDFVSTLTLPNVPDLKITIDVPETLRVYFDPEQLKQILINLCENGVRYSFQATGCHQLHLKGSPHHEREERAYLDVIDLGHGVAPEILELIFDPFFTTESNGNGLGLFVVKSLCEANQSDIAYHPTNEGQSCFRIYFSHYVPDAP